MDTLVRLADGACPIVEGVVFTATVKTSVVAIDIANPTGATQLVDVKIENQYLFIAPMPAPGGVSWHGPQVLEAGESLKIRCDSASCTYNISGVEIT